MSTFQPRFAGLALLLLAVEVAIARYVHTGLIRSFIPDVLVNFSKIATITRIKVTNNTTFALLINLQGSNIVIKNLK